jgi:hypothetical protein
MRNKRRGKGPARSDHESVLAEKNMVLRFIDTITTEKGKKTSKKKKQGKAQGTLNSHKTVKYA